MRTKIPVAACAAGAHSAHLVLRKIVAEKRVVRGQSHERKEVTGSQVNVRFLYSPTRHLVFLFGKEVQCLGTCP